MTAYAITLGLLFGSFLNVVTYRVPRGLSIVRPGSHCTNCGTPIRAYDNVPIISWLVLRGRARCCKARISVRYPLVELMSGLFGWAVLRCIVLALPAETPWWRALGLFSIHLALGLGLLAAALIDISHMILPNTITVGGTLLGLLTVPLRPGIGWLDALVGAAVGFLMVWLPFDLLHRLLRGRPGMGLGDAKLVMLAGAWFGWVGAVTVFMAGAVQGTIGAVVILLVQGRIDEPEAVTEERRKLVAAIEAAEGDERRELEEELARDPVGSKPESGWRKSRMAFGPFLVLALIEYQLFGEAIVNGYLEFVGWQ
ncbi:MAG: prepilin peptidase [Polyangiaceae bacterium]|nr:prepilin peptidase [Polyangiaceae bacterium]